MKDDTGDKNDVPSSNNEPKTRDGQIDIRDQSLNSESEPRNDALLDVAVIGAGAAGLTAAIYACRAGRKVAVFEKIIAGGQIVNTSKIANYPATPGISGAEWGRKLAEQAENLGAKLIFEEVEKIEYFGKPAEAGATQIGPESEPVKGFVEHFTDENNRGVKGLTKRFTLTTDEGKYVVRTVIFASGSEPRKMGLAREDELVGRGVSYCATCDGAFYKGKTVAVIGGGNSALAAAVYLADLAEKVYLVHRREEYRGDKTLQGKIATKTNIEPVLGYVPAEILGDKKVEGLKVVHVQTSASEQTSAKLSEATNRIPANQNEAAIQTSAERVLEISGIFVEIGREPNNQLIADLADLDENGYVIADESCATKTPGLFVAGDCRAKNLRQLVTATSDGAIAATQASAFLG